MRIHSGCLGESSSKTPLLRIRPRTKRVSIENSQEFRATLGAFRHRRFLRVRGNLPPDWISDSDSNPLCYRRAIASVDEHQSQRLEIRIGNTWTSCTPFRHTSSESNAIGIHIAQLREELTLNSRRGTSASVYRRGLYPFDRFVRRPGIPDFRHNSLPLSQALFGPSRCLFLPRNSFQCLKIPLSCPQGISLDRKGIGRFQFHRAFF